MKMSSSTSECSSNFKRSSSSPSTTHTSPDHATSTTTTATTTTKKQQKCTLTFEKRTDFTARPAHHAPSAFSSFTSDTDTILSNSETHQQQQQQQVATKMDSTSTTASASSSSSVSSVTSGDNTNQHHHLASSPKSTVSNSDKFPFTNLSNNQGDPRATFLNRTQSSISIFTTEQNIRKSNYKPALHFMGPGPQAQNQNQNTNQTQHKQKRRPAKLQPWSSIFSSEEQAREAAIKRTNYSLPPSPTSGIYSPIPRYQALPSTPIKPNNYKTTVPPHPQPYEESYFPFSNTFAASGGPPSRSHWKPDSSRNACAECNRLFTLFERRHHCRRCGDIFCGLHSRFTVLLDQNVSFNPFNGTPSRACLSCLTEYKEFKTFIDEHHVGSSSSATSTNSTTTPTATLSRVSSPQPTTTPTAIHAGHDTITSNNNDNNNAHTNFIGSVKSPVIPADWQWSTF